LISDITIRWPFRQPVKLEVTYSRPTFESLLDKEEVAYRIAPFYNTLINKVKKYLPVAKEVIKRVANVDEAR
jgi:hypothetical protein